MNFLLDRLKLGTFRGSGGAGATIGRPGGATEKAMPAEESGHSDRVRVCSEGGGLVLIRKAADGRGVTSWASMCCGI
jgi:hypothetical protein